MPMDGTNEKKTLMFLLHSKLTIHCRGLVENSLDVDYLCRISCEAKAHLGSSLEPRGSPDHLYLMQNLLVIGALQANHVSDDTCDMTLNNPSHRLLERDIEITG